MHGNGPIPPPNENNLREHFDFPWPNGSSFPGAIRPRGEQSGDQWRVDDLIVFIALESLGTLAITLNVCLCIVLLRHKYLHRASFVLMLSLALADVLHGLVTTSFFYPPILLRQSPVPAIGVRLFNILDWTAWSITLTHMSAICLDRLLAIIMYGRYNQLITVGRARVFTLSCWSAFFALNSGYILAQFCCLISPLRESHFYTFGYGEFENEDQLRSAPFGAANLFKLTYTPLEVATLAVLSISNPITLIQLYRRHKRKMALRIQRSSPPMGVGDALLRRASTMLLEVSMRMGSKHVSNEVQQVASRRASRQQQRILLQISVVAIIFYCYMSVYYLLYHVLNVSNKWVVLFNSFFYSTTHMINPVIYFSLNKDMRVQLIRAIADFLNWICCVGNGAGGHGTSSIYGRKRAESSSGSGLRKSSPGEQPTSTAQPSGWTLRTFRLPTATSAKSARLLSPNGHRSEKMPLLRVPSAPPPSTASSSFFLDPAIARQVHDPNNNGPLNNNTIDQRQRREMAELAVQVAEVVKQKVEEKDKKLEAAGEEEKPLEMPMEPVKSSSVNFVEEALKKASTGSIQFDGPNLGQAKALANEQLELELVDTWSVEDVEKGGSVKQWREEALDGLSRIRGLGSFLAEQLAGEAAKQDREWGRARRQRNSLLDALIRALVETEEGRTAGKKRNGLLEVEGRGLERKKSHSFDCGHKPHPQAVANGWPGRSSSRTTTSEAHALSSSSTDLAGQESRRKHGIVSYRLLRESHGSISLEQKKGMEGEESEEGEVIFL